MIGFVSTLIELGSREMIIFGATLAEECGRKVNSGKMFFVRKSNGIL